MNPVYTDNGMGYLSDGILILFICMWVLPLVFIFFVVYMFYKIYKQQKISSGVKKLAIISGVFTLYLGIQFLRLWL